MKQVAPSRTELGKFLRSRREELGFSKAEVARNLGRSEVLYKGWEAGYSYTSKPNDKDLTKLATLFKVALEHLNDLRGLLKPTQEPNAKPARKSMNRLASGLEKENRELEQQLEPFLVIWPPIISYPLHYELWDIVEGPDCLEAFVTSFMAGSRGSAGAPVSLKIKPRHDEAAEVRVLAVQISVLRRTDVCDVNGMIEFAGSWEPEDFPGVNAGPVTGRYYIAWKRGTLYIGPEFQFRVM